jgi:MEMO1 family protein
MVPGRSELVKTGLGRGKRRRYNDLMERSVRQPVVAGSFYPANPAQLRDLVRGFLGADLPARGSSSVGVIVPHAGYVYSGRVAGAGLRAASAFGKPDVVIILGASHGGAGGALAVPVEDAWRTPLGDVPLDRPTIERLVSHGIGASAAAFRREHSIEVVLPFLQVLFPEPPAVVPVCVQFAAWAALVEGARAVASVLDGRTAWVIASSDFTHYEPDAVARRLDRAALDRILAGDAEVFYRQTIEQGLTICGAAAICVLLLLARDLGLGRSALVEYATSGDVSGDRSAVVGYAAAAFTKESS